MFEVHHQVPIMLISTRAMTGNHIFPLPTPKIEAQVPAGLQLGNKAARSSACAERAFLHFNRTWYASNVRKLDEQRNWKIVLFQSSFASEFGGVEWLSTDEIGVTELISSQRFSAHATGRQANSVWITGSKRVCLSLIIESGNIKYLYWCLYYMNRYEIFFVSSIKGFFFRYHL